jgi:erythromycin esterase
MTSEPDPVSLVREHAQTLTSIDPGEPLDDLAPLARIVGDADLVALGEATHGSREFFQLKHRIVRYLVMEMGFTLFGIEASWPECIAINEYVVDGIGEPAPALAGQGFWTWDTEEVLALIEWMRAHNRNLPVDSRVHFFGFDAVHASVACEILAAFLERSDAAYAHEIAAPLRDLKALQPFLPPETIQAGQLATTLIGDVQSRLLDYGERSIANTSEAEWIQAKQCAAVLRQIDEKRRERDSARQFTLRDIAMAANVQWRLALDATRRKTILWAHNGHVTRDTRGMFDESITTMGQSLSHAFGDTLVTIGFAFGDGSFQAIVDADSDQPRLDEVTIGPAPAGSFDAVLARASDGPALLLDLRVEDPRLRDWLAHVQVTRETGAIYTSERDMERTIVPSASFDALVFVNRTTRARPTATGHRPKR